MRRTIGRMLLFAAAAILGAACGSSHTATSATAARGAISKAQATAYAHDVNLIAADVPFSKVTSPEAETDAPSQASIEFARCAGGVSPNRRVVNIKSVALGIGNTGKPAQVRSSVEVMPTAALAARNYAAIRSARGRACLARLLPQVLKTTARRRVRFGPATVSLLLNLLSTGQESFGVRVTTTVTGKRRGKQTRVRVYIDVFDLLAGPAEVNLSANGFSEPVSTATEGRLLSLLYGRAEAHKL